MTLGSERVIIGLTGPFGAGCSKVAEALLQGKKYQVIKLSQSINDHMAEHSISPENGIKLIRQKQKIGNSMREESGDDAILARKALARVRKKTRICFDGIKNPGEVDYLRKQGRFALVAIDALEDVRFSRAEAAYECTKRAFQEVDEHDREERNSHGQNVQLCVDLADAVVRNDDEFASKRVQDDFCNRVDKYFTLAETPGSRAPYPWEAHMVTCYTQASQSSCMRRQVGAVLVSANEDVVYLGYNDVPKGQVPCVREHGNCYRYLEDPDDPLSLAQCRAVHAEMRALLKAPRSHSMGGTLYCTTFPCKQCANAIIFSKVARVVFVEPYPDYGTEEMLKSAGVEIERFEGVKARAYQTLFRRERA